MSIEAENQSEVAVPYKIVGGVIGEIEPNGTLDIKDGKTVDIGSGDAIDCVIGSPIGGIVDYSNLPRGSRESSKIVGMIYTAK